MADCDKYLQLYNQLRYQHVDLEVDTSNEKVEGVNEILSEQQIFQVR